MLFPPPHQFTDVLNMLSCSHYPIRLHVNYSWAITAMPMGKGLQPCQVCLITEQKLSRLSFSLVILRESNSLVVGFVRVSSSWKKSEEKVNT